MQTLPQDLLEGLHPFPSLGLSSEAQESHMGHCCLLSFTLPWKRRKYLKPQSAVKPRANVLEEAIQLALSILGYTPTSSTNGKWKVFFKIACVLIM